MGSTTRFFFTPASNDRECSRWRNLLAYTEKRSAGRRYFITYELWRNPALWITSVIIWTVSVWVFSFRARTRMHVQTTFVRNSWIRLPAYVLPREGIVFYRKEKSRFRTPDVITMVARNAIRKRIYAKLRSWSFFPMGYAMRLTHCLQRETISLSYHVTINTVSY